MVKTPPAGGEGAAQGQGGAGEMLMQAAGTRPGAKSSTHRATPQEDLGEVL